MISHQEAIDIINKSVKAKSAFTLPIAKALHFELTKNVKSQVNSPAFAQSAMDGFAYAHNSKSLILETEDISAGSTKKTILNKGKAIRIYTGAMMPLGANTVVPQEFVEIKNGEIFFDRTLFEQGANVRKQGSHFEKGEVLLTKGIKLNALNISLAASAGIAEVEVLNKPKVSVIVSGDELIAPGKKLKKGQVYESNSIMLQLLLQQAGYEVNFVSHCKDNLKAMEKLVMKVGANSDVILFTGGISVGKYDFTSQLFSSLNIKTMFYKIAQKPGKPLYLGKSGSKYFFGLPGNPAAVYTCFNEYVIPLLQKLSGENKQDWSFKAILSNSFKKKKGLTHFLKAEFSAGEVQILPNQESYKITAFNEANCLVVVPQEIESLKKGDEVTCRKLVHNMI
jgi:molybdopterin molybdotransferase